MLDKYKIKERLNLINKRINLIKRIKSKSIQYIFRKTKISSGKRLRGLLVVLTAELNNSKDTEKAINTAVAMELLHHATLIHDDIVDNSEKRRGIDTLNRSIGYEFSVLTGDYIFYYVTDLLLKNNDWGLLKLFVDATRGICQGEIDEVYNKYNINLGINGYLNIIRNKTALLIKTSVKAGAYVAGIASNAVKALENYGENLGLAFQIKDDILDITGDEKKLGKRIGNDIREGKVTLPFIIAMKNAGQTKSSAIKKKFLTRKNHTDEIIDFIMKYNGIEDAEKMAAGYINKAKGFLGKAKVKYEAKKEVLEIMADYVMERNY